MRTDEPQFFDANLPAVASWRWRVMFEHARTPRRR
jgi:hypothetical protein